MVKVSVIAVLMGFGMSWGTLQAAEQLQQKLQVSLQFAVGQPNAPIAISSSTTVEQQIHADVTLTNRSTRRITAVTMGVMLSAPRYQSARYLISGTQVALALDPGATTSVTTSSFFAPQIVNLVGTMTELGIDVQFGALNEPDVAVELGVLDVRYADGTSWTFDPVAQGGFSAPNGAGR